MVDALWSGDRTMCADICFDHLVNGLRLKELNVIRRGSGDHWHA